MKKIVTYIFGIFTGIVVSLVGLFILFHYVTSTARPIEPSKSVKKSLKVNSGQMAVLDFTNGTALIDFTSFGNQAAEYRWRYREKASGIETSGNGRVFEKYRDLFWGNFFKKQIGQLFIYAGQVRVEWSAGGTDTAWLYYQSDRTKTTLLNNDEFKTLDLSKIKL